jgi:hypothetical protein
MLARCTIYQQKLPLTSRKNVGRSVGQFASGLRSRSLVFSLLLFLTTYSHSNSENERNIPLIFVLKYCTSQTVNCSVHEARLPILMKDMDLETQELAFL